MGKTGDVEDRSHVEPFYLGHLLDTTKVDLMFSDRHHSMLVEQDENRCLGLGGL